MKKLSLPLLFALAAVAFVVAALLSAVLVSSGNSPLLVTPWMAAVFLLFAAYLLGSGLQVRKYKRGQPTNLSALGAARVAVLARVCAHFGSVFFGLLAGVGAVGLMRLWAPATAASAVGAGIAALGALVLVVCAVVAERWCLDDGGSSDLEGRKGDSDSGQSVAGTAARTHPRNEVD